MNNFVRNTLFAVILMVYLMVIGLLIAAFGLVLIPVIPKLMQGSIPLILVVPGGYGSVLFSMGI